MFTATFDSAVRIAHQAELQARFGSDRVYLADYAAVVFEGAITIGPEVSFSGDCHVVGPTRIDAGSHLTSVRLGRGNHVRAYSILANLVAGDRNLFGPFCFIRDDCRVGDDCILGAHVEAARSRFADRVKISHRAFVGDAQVGPGSIIGAGVVFCNYDGKGRQATQIGARVTIGSGSLLVPPLAVGDEVVVAAGSTVTKDLPAGVRFIQKR